MPRTLSLLVALALLLGAGCSKPKPPPPKPFDCPSFQQRARECEQATIDVLKARLKSEAGGPDFDQQFQMLESRLRKRIAEGRPGQQCDRIVAGTDAARISKIKACHAAASCDAFAECLIEL
jgi:hypothetical protein